MELLQACALIHDDVMDHSDTRRGRPAVHREFESLHARSGWSSDSEDFGIGAAILLGDLCLTWADALLLNAIPGPSSGRSDSTHLDLAAAKQVYDELRTELMAGQYLDLLEQARNRSNVESALRVATYKSAKYTVERPLQVGAALAGADAAVISELRRYGVALGLAFQLRDDMLGVFGDPAQTGKPAGDDLREGKRTVLVALTEAALGAADLAWFSEHFGDPDADADTLLRLREMIESTNASSEVEAMIAGYADEALAALEAATQGSDPDGDQRIDATAESVLRGLVVAATRRSN
jgi:geranylgeranyl diphosphate synthase type I